VLATDVSVRALSIARKNAQTHKVKIDLMKSDLLQQVSYMWLKRHASSDTELVICANLPYLPVGDKGKLQRDVEAFEPYTALFSGKDGNTLILRFMRQLARHLPEWGYGGVTLLFEFDPPQAQTLADAARTLFPSATVTIMKDLAERDRVLRLDL
jgi:release factor glutamine methyltransferase